MRVNFFEGKKMKKEMFFVVSLVFVGLLVLVGCSQKSEPPAEEEAGELIGNVISEVEQAVSDQAMCPIMDKPINKNIFVEYEGKKVYFCCKGCEDKFEADPAAYMAKLPQFPQ
jgi:YHS domain-containing protein